MQSDASLELTLPVYAAAEQTLVKKEELKQAIKKDAARAEQEVGVAYVAALRKKLLNAAIERIEAERKGAAIAEDECAICVVRSPPATVRPARPG